MFNSDLSNDADKPFHHGEYHSDLNIVTKNYVSTNGFETGNKRQLEMDRKVIRIGYRDVIIKFSYFKYDSSLLKELLILSFSERSNLLKPIIEGIFNIDLMGKEVVIKRWPYPSHRIFG